MPVLGNSNPLCHLRIHLHTPRTASSVRDVSEYPTQQSHNKLENQDTTVNFVKIKF